MKADLTKKTAEAAAAQIFSVERTHRPGTPANITFERHFSHPERNHISAGILTRGRRLHSPRHAGLAMAQTTAKFLREQIARIQRLLEDITDARTERALQDLAEEYEARATEQEAAAKKLHGGPP